jgi:YidC/Oxa1 family membrane protein insertase
MSSSKRVILAVVLSLGILVAWQYLLAPTTPPRAPGPKTGTGAAPTSQPAEAQPTSQPTSRPASEPTSQPAGSGPRARNLDGDPLTLKRPGFSATFTTTGGALRHFVLHHPRYQEWREGELRPVDLVRTQAGKGPWPLTVNFLKSEIELPVNARFEKVGSTANEVTYRWQSSKVWVRKHYAIDPVRPLIWLTVEVGNRTPASLRGRLEISLFNRQAPDQEKASFTNPYPVIPMVSCYANGELHRRSADAIAGRSSGCSAAGCGMDEGELPSNKGTGEVLWIGSDDRNFLTAVVPQDKTDARRCELKLLKDEVLHASLQYPESVFEAGKSQQFRFAIFVGPKDLQLLDSVKAAGNTEGRLGDAVDYGWFAVLCRPMLWLMKIFYSWFGNWGVAIILLTIIVKLLTLYWTQKSMRSMKEMQRLKPKIDALREKFKDDKQRFNQEMMALYKVHKVNPLGGCLPMLIQMPIWFALYRTLGNAVELYRSGFVGWITDLTAPDPYYVLPIAMGIAMYAQQAITPQPMEGTQAKMMKYFMPGIFTVMMLALPSGLTLYIFVNTVLTMIHQWYMNKTDPYRDTKPPEPTAKEARVPEANKARAKRRRK